MNYTKPFKTIPKNCVYESRKILYNDLPLIQPYNMSYRIKNCLWNTPIVNNFFKEIQDYSNVKNCLRNFEVIGVYNLAYVDGVAVNTYDPQNGRMYIAAPNIGHSIPNIPPKKFAIFTYNDNGEPYYFRGIFSLNSLEQSVNARQWVLTEIDDKMTWEL